MQEDVACPACLKRNRDTKLLLKQISFESAVYLCPVKKCRYPKGFSWLVVKRSFDEFTEIICKRKQEEKEKNAADNNFLQDLLSTNTQDDENQFSSILSDLNNISATTQETNISKSPENIQSEVDSLKDIGINDKFQSNEDTHNESFSLAESSDIFSTSVNEILTEFMTEPAQKEKETDFNLEDFFLDDILQF